MYNIHGWTIRQEQTHVAIHGIAGEHKFAAYHATHILTGEGRLPIGGSERDSHAWRPGRPGCLPRAAPYPRTSHMQRTLQATNPRQEALQLEARRVISIQNIEGIKNPADVLTKYLGKPDYIRYTSRLYNSTTDLEPRTCNAISAQRRKGGV